MKVIVEQKDGEGIISLLGKQVLVFCVNYFYYGKLVGVHESCIKLENAYQVMETGAHSDKTFKDAQKLGELPHYVQIEAIESFCETVKVPK